MGSAMGFAWIINIIFTHFRSKTELMQQCDSQQRGRVQSLCLRFLRDGVSVNCSSCKKSHEGSSSRGCLGMPLHLPALGFGDVHDGLCREQQGLLICCCFNALSVLSEGSGSFFGLQTLGSSILKGKGGGASALCHLLM